jgi:tetratricopeptide (TPR) repeat protein
MLPHPIYLLLFLLALPQAPNSIRQHYEAAEAQRRAGNLAAAEAEYTAILAEGYGKLGQIYSAEKDFKQAITGLEMAARIEPRNEAVLVDLAIAYFDTDQYEKALEPLGKALALNPQSKGAHHMLGKTYFMLGEFNKSVTELETVLRLAPNDYDVTYTLGLAHLKQHELPPAKQIYDRMLAQLGDRPQLHILFGRAYRETAFLSEAIEEFRKAIALDPKFPRAHYYLGLTYLLKEGASRLADAADEFNLELKQHPDQFFANYYLGIVNLIERNWEPAISFLEKASQIQPQNPDPYFHLGQAYLSVGKYARAIEVLEKSIARNPALNHNDYQVTTAHYRLGQALVKAGRKEEGERELEIASKLKSEVHKRDEEKLATYLDQGSSQSKLPANGSVEGLIAESNELDENGKRQLKNSEAYYLKIIAAAHNGIGLLRAQGQDFRGAAEQFAAAREIDPTLADIDFNLGLASYKAEQYKDSITPFEREIGVHPDNRAAKRMLGLSYFMLEDYAKASALLTEVVTSQSSDVGLYYTLALSLIKQGQQDAADRVIEKMVTVGGDTPQLHILLGQAYNERGETAKALDELNTALKLDAKQSLAHHYLGLIYLKAGKFDEAAQQFQNELTQNPTDVEAKYNLAFVLLASQKTDRGINLLREVIHNKPDYAEAYYELGKALLVREDITGAIENLETAVKLKPDRSYAHYQLGRAYLAAGRRTEGENQLELARQLKEKERSQTNP